MPESRRVGLVIAGASARGAYEAGALSALLPRLEQAGMRPRVLLGTSAGSINAAYLAAKLHLGAERATEGLAGLWCSLNKPDLIGPLARTAIPALLGYAGRIAYLKTGRGSFAEFGRFPEVLDAAVGDWGQIQANIEAGELDAVGVVATAAASGGSVVFVQGAPDVELPHFDEHNGIRYVRAGASYWPTSPRPSTSGTVPSAARAGNSVLAEHVPRRRRGLVSALAQCSTRMRRP